MKSSKTRTPKTTAPDNSTRTINDLMSTLDQEIEMLKVGSLTEPKARVIAKNRELQLRGFELILNAAKLEAKLRPELGRRVGIPMIGPSADEPKGVQ